MKLITSIYKSSKKEEMYLYVEKAKALTEVPEKLLELFGTPIHVMDLLLRKERPLARADVEKVMTDIKSQGFHLQMPPQKDDYLIELPDELLTMNDPV
ncbi:YcgL domain-containing protein [Aestuariirhabdus sp. Z084]|uniref:YcgL domain-containing protein n=1 Tax=Aestuariirhabdus haliotis TaxID=2918751 RepID=UPI00201B3C39|nr:YcgL domain-containing protein [Aestuariirhabdus haliotis]MCL6416901.1 YcgL domain-containing protein [Aestuariirhabdus haliotis]MCL6420880.1 YcgL domain-containing protein [Aestuariirhabdus haliotis]